MIGSTVLRLVIFFSFLHYSLSVKCYQCSDKTPRSKRDDASGNATAAEGDSGENKKPEGGSLPPCSEKTETDCPSATGSLYCYYMRLKKSDGVYDSADCKPFIKMPSLPGMPAQKNKNLCDDIIDDPPGGGKVENCYSCQSDLCNTQEAMESKGNKGVKSGVEGVKQRRSFLLEIFTLVFSVFLLKIYY